MISKSKQFLQLINSCKTASECIRRCSCKFTQNFALAELTVGLFWYHHSNNMAKKASKMILNEALNSRHYDSFQSIVVTFTFVYN
jgi:hypothetical protein